MNRRTGWEMFTTCFCLITIGALITERLVEGWMGIPIGAVIGLLLGYFGYKPAETIAALKKAFAVAFPATAAWFKYQFSKSTIKRRAGKLFLWMADDVILPAVMLAWYPIIIYWIFPLWPDPTKMPSILGGIAQIIAGCVIIVIFIGAGMIVAANYFFGFLMVFLPKEKSQEVRKEWKRDWHNFCLFCNILSVTIITIYGVIVGIPMVWRFIKAKLLETPESFRSLGSCLGIFFITFCQLIDSRQREICSVSVAVGVVIAYLLRTTVSGLLVGALIGALCGAVFVWFSSIGLKIFQPAREANQ